MKLKLDLEVINERVMVIYQCIGNHDNGNEVSSFQEGLKLYQLICKNNGESHGKTKRM